MTFKAATLPWLVAHELRLAWRERRGKKIVGLAIVALLLALLALSFVDTPGAVLNQSLRTTPRPDWLVWASVQGFGLTLFLAFLQALRASTITLFERGDLDLLIASPLSSKVIFASRLLSIGLSSFVTMGGLVVIPCLVFMALGVFRLAGVFPALLALCLLGTSLALLTNLLLVRCFGVRRTRTVSAFAVIPFLLIVRWVNHQPKQLTALTTQFPILRADSWLWWPTRALFFDPLALLLLFGVTAGAVWLTVETLHGWFLSGTQDTAGGKPGRRGGTAASREGPPRFNTGMNRVILLKEWRVMKRDPDLLSRLTLSLVLLAPFFGSVLRPSEAGSMAGSLMTGVVVIIAMALTTALANLSICGEESPALLQTAPVADGRVRRLKLLAVLLPVWGMMVPLIGLVEFTGYPGGSTALVVIGASIGTALLRLWNGQLISPSSLRRGRSNPSRDGVLSLLEWISYGLWLVLGGLIGMDWSGLGLALMLLVLGIMAGAYWRNRWLGPSLT